MAILHCKVAVVGDATVGKTALVATAANGPSGFPKNYVMTPAASIQTKQVKLEDSGVTVELQLVDTSGQSIFRDVTLEMVRLT